LGPKLIEVNMQKNVKLYQVTKNPVGDVSWIQTPTQPSSVTFIRLYALFVDKPIPPK